MKPKDFKNISEKEKNDSKFAYNYEKAESDIRFGLSWLLE